MKRLLREPLFHFLLIGGTLFRASRDPEWGSTAFRHISAN